MKGVDFVYNGQAFGDVADRLMEVGGNPALLRPWRHENGGTYLTVNAKKDKKTGVTEFKNVRVNNASLLRKDEWIHFDEAIMMAARSRLRVWADVASRAQLVLPNGMGSTVLQHQRMSDAGEAITSMDGLEEENNDRTVFDLVNLPLPITHAGFKFGSRDIAVSRRNGIPLDVTMAEQCTRRVIERIEKMTIGTLSNYTYGGGTIYGIRTYPDRVTKTITLPTAAGWSPKLHISEVLNMRTSLKANQFHGPYALYYSPGWTQYLDDDYSSAYNGDSLRSRLQKNPNFVVIDDADYVPDYEVMMVQLTGDTIRAVNGMKLSMIQYDTNGGLARRFKIVCIYVPQMRSNANGNTGICHATAA